MSQLYFTDRQQDLFDSGWEYLSRIYTNLVCKWFAAGGDEFKVHLAVKNRWKSKKKKKKEKNKSRRHNDLQDDSELEDKDDTDNDAISLHSLEDTRVVDDGTMIKKYTDPNYKPDPEPTKMVENPEKELISESLMNLREQSLLLQTSIYELQSIPSLRRENMELKNKINEIQKTSFEDVLSKIESKNSEQQAIIMEKLSAMENLLRETKKSEPIKVRTPDPQINTQRTAGSTVVKEEFKKDFLKSISDIHKVCSNLDSSNYIDKHPEISRLLGNIEVFLNSGSAKILLKQCVELYMTLHNVIRGYDDKMKMIMMSLQRELNS